MVRVVIKETANKLFSRVLSAHYSLQPATITVV